MSVYAKGGYLDQKTRSPLSLGAAVAINGAMVGALLFANPDIIRNVPTVIDVIHIPLDPPPDPVKPPEQPKQKAQTPQKPIEQVETTKPLPPTGSKFTWPEPELPVGKGIAEGTETTTTTKVPPHIPVLVGPKIHPRYRDKLQPPYPPGKIRSDEEGVVVVRVLIGADGRVKQVQKVEASDDAFFRATQEQALRYWRFLPATEDGVAVESWETKTVRFRLDQI